MSWCRVFAVLSVLELYSALRPGLTPAQDTTAVAAVVIALGRARTRTVQVVALLSFER